MIFICLLLIYVSQKSLMLSIILLNRARVIYMSTSGSFFFLLSASKFEENKSSLQLLMAVSDSLISLTNSDT